MEDEHMCGRTDGRTAVISTALPTDRARRQHVGQRGIRVARTEAIASGSSLTTCVTSET